MAHSLFGLFDENQGGLIISRHPYDEKYWPRYMAMRRADIWTDFPARGYSLVNAEFKAGDEDQRIDLLYLRVDGALLPCELKLGGSNNKDAHGQLIRYIADLYYQKIDLAWLRTEHKKFIDSITDSLAQQLHADKLENFLEKHRIEDRFLRILPQTGILMDIEFPSQLLKAVRYLNGYCGFAIRLLQIEAFVDDQWKPESVDYMFRLDFVDVQ